MPWNPQQQHGGQLPFASLWKFVFEGHSLRSCCYSMGKPHRTPTTLPSPPRVDDIYLVQHLARPSTSDDITQKRWQGSFLWRPSIPLHTEKDLTLPATGTSTPCCGSLGPWHCQFTGNGPWRQSFPGNWTKVVQTRYFCCPVKGQMECLLLGSGFYFIYFFFWVRRMRTHSSHGLIWLHYLAMTTFTSNCTGRVSVYITTQRFLSKENFLNSHSDCGWV